MFFDCVICTKNNALTIGPVIRALKRGIPTRRILLIDRFSRDGTREAAESLGCIVVDSELGLAQARRLGAILAETPYFVSLDGDIVIPPNFYQVLSQYVESNKITKGIYYDMLRPGEKAVSDRNFYWITHKVGSFDCCIIERRWFLDVSKDWRRRGLDAGEDTDTFLQCEEKGYSVHQDNRVVSRHYQFNMLRLIKQTRWYGKGSRRGKIRGRFTLTRPYLLPVEMLLFPVMGLVEAFKFHSPKLFLFESAKMLFWFWGYFIG